MSNPKVTIIIPAYNAGLFAKRCLDSILQLKYSNWECFVVNDGSTDNTLEIIESYAYNDTRIHIINKHNGGVSSARNAGIEQAQGEWITFVDIDDYVSHDFLCTEDFCTQSELIVKNWQYSDNKSSNEEIPIGKLISLKGDDGIARYLHYTVFRTPWAKLFRTDIIKINKIHFNPCFKLGEDNLFVIEYLQNVKNIYISDGSYIYESPKKNKYPLTFDESIKYLHTFAVVYYKLGIKSPILLKYKLNWYISFIIDFNLSKKIFWYKDKIINKMYIDSIKHFNFKIRLKVYVFRFFNLF